LPRTSETQRIWLWSWGIFALALAVRLIYLAQVRGLPFFDHPIMDASYHDTWAREILAGKASRGEPFFRAPLYPYSLALVYLVSKGSYLAPRLVQFVLGGLTCAITFNLARRYFGLLAGAVAGLACAVYPVLIYFDGELLTENLFILLSMAGLTLLEMARRRQRLGIWFAAGLALGAALITRPNLAIFLPVAVAGAALFARRRLTAALVVAAGLAIPLAPVTVHNYVVSGEFVPLVWQGGINFYLGNNPAATGWSATSPDVRKDWWGGYNDMIAVPREALGRQPGYNEVSDYWTARGLAFIRNRPAEWLGLTLKKMALFWGSRELPNNQDFNFMKLYSWVLRNPLVTFGTLAPLALVALFVFWPQARRLYFLYGLVLTSFVGTVAFLVCDRYRLPAVPPIAIFAGGAAAYLVALVRRRAIARLAILGCCLTGAALVVNLNLAGMRLPDFAQSYCAVGKIYGSIGDDTQAAVYYNKALGVNPRWGEAYEQLGLISMREGDNRQAEDLLVKATQVWPDFAAPHRALAMIYLSEGKIAEARQALEAALRLAPYLEDCYNVLGSIQRREGRPAEAIESFRKEIQINPSGWRAFANLGGSYEEVGDPDQAAEAYQRSLDLNPDNPEVTLALATLYAKSGRYDLAKPLMDRLGAGALGDLNLKYNRAAILQNSGSIEEAKQLYEEILAASPVHEGSLVNLGVIYAKQGLTDRARELWLRALEVNPGNATARRNLELLTEPR
jgi:tetratricopeptide (TPR) repeat protein